MVGTAAYPNARRLLISADAGGSNGYLLRLWKVELAALATDTGQAITVCHFPPGTSKWNRIEHRLFAHITMNWRGRPLTSHQVIVDLIGATATGTGLKVHAETDPGSYPRGIKIRDQQMAAIAPPRSNRTPSTRNGTYEELVISSTMAQGWGVWLPPDSGPIRENASR